MTDGLIAIWTCCRPWPVIPAWGPVGTCGYCGQQPRPTRTRTAG